MRAREVLPAGGWDTTREIDRVLIDYDRRFRRRIVLTTVLGAEVLIDLPVAVRLRDGEGLLGVGGVVRVCAQASGANGAWIVSTCPPIPSTISPIT